MAVRDVIHDAVRNALIKDGWMITHDPFTITYEDATVFADLAAERAIAAEKAGRKIVVEVKSFVGQSPVHDFEVALGQYQTYLPFMKAKGLEHKLYLAITDVTYADVFQRKSIQLLLEWHRLPLIVVNSETEEIVLWIN
jgi:hypothetical protein